MLTYQKTIVIATHSSQVEVKWHIIGDHRRKHEIGHRKRVKRTVGKSL